MSKKQYVPEALRVDGEDYSLKTPINVTNTHGETIEFTVKEGKEEKVYAISKNAIRDMLGSL